MSRAVVMENKAFKKACDSRSDLLKNDSNNGEKKNSKGVKYYASTQVEAKRDCPEERLNESQNAEFAIDEVSTEIPKNEPSSGRIADSEKTVNGLSVDSNNASDSVYPLANDESIALKLEALSKHNSIKDLCDGGFQDFDILGIRRDKDYKSYFDAMYAKVLEDEGNDAPHDDIMLSSGSVVDSAEKAVQASFSEYKTEESDFFSQFGSRKLFLMPDLRIFSETEEEYTKEVTDGDMAELTYNVDERKGRQNKSLNAEMSITSIEHGTIGDSNSKRTMHTLKIQAVDFNAKHIEPIVRVDQKTFRINLDVSFFDIENITCVVGDKLDVHARVSRKNDYGTETHQIHQVFDVPALVNRDKFTACIKSGLLHLEAPMEQSTD